MNGLSAGPVRTLAASGIGDFRTMLKWNELNAPLRRNVTIQDVGDSLALYLISPWSSGVTGEIHYVDGGANINGMVAMDQAGELGALLSEYRRQEGLDSRHMAGNSFRERSSALRTFGESHGPQIGCIVDGVPAGPEPERGGHPARLWTGASRARASIVTQRQRRGRGLHRLRRVRGHRRRARPSA